MTAKKGWYRQESVTFGRFSKREPICKIAISKMMDEKSPATWTKQINIHLLTLENKWSRVEHKNYM